MWRASSLAMLAAFSPLLICTRQAGKDLGLLGTIPPHPSPPPPPPLPSPGGPSPTRPRSSPLVLPPTPTSPFVPPPHVSPLHFHSPARPQPESRCLPARMAAASTFCATWLTQGDVQLLRSGPRGFQSPKAGRHWNEAIPATTDRTKRVKGKERRGQRGKEVTER